MHILDKIVAHKKREVILSRQKTGFSQLENSKHFSRICNSYRNAITSKENSGVIAEFKRKSPSRADINLTADLEEVTSGYVAGGASAISILTDQFFFGGSDKYLKKARSLFPTFPLLRKEFIIEEYQILESKAIGADIILLICEILTKQQVYDLAKLAKELGMEVLLEMHTADQIDKYNEHVSMVGINNRDLKTFEVDYERSKNLYDQLPLEVPKIAESGLSETATCAMLYNYGFRGFLIGEQFMKQNHPGLACKEFILDFKQKRNEQ